MDEIVECLKIIFDIIPWIYIGMIFFNYILNKLFNLFEPIKNGKFNGVEIKITFENIECLVRTTNSYGVIFKKDNKLIFIGYNDFSFLQKCKLLYHLIIIYFGVKIFEEEIKNYSRIRFKKSTLTDLFNIKINIE